MKTKFGTDMIPERPRRDFRPPRWLLRCLCVAALVTAGGLATSSDRWVMADESLDFDRSVAPILVARCLGCHSGEEPKGGLSLSSRQHSLRGGDSGPALVAGDWQTSLIGKRIETGEMPPDDKLSDFEIGVLRDWVDQGGKWGTDPIDAFRVTTSKRAGYDWWALRPVRRPDVPELEDAPGDHAIDAFVLRRLKREGMTPSEKASPRVLVRRLHFDLVGLPPSPDDVESFVRQSDQDPHKAVVDRVDQLLDSPHFGERWGRHWLDVVRFGESHGFERDQLRGDSWHYRDWVIDAMNSDLPYDEFVRLQIAGDVLLPDDVDAITATGFLVAGPWDQVGQSQRSPAMKAIVRQDEIEDYVGTIGQTFLGLTLNCARCHDHKFDPVRQREYYQLASAVAGVAHGSRKVGSQTVYAVKPVKPAVTHVLRRGNPAAVGDVVRPQGLAAISTVDADFRLPLNPSDGQRRIKLAQWITDPQNPLFPRVIVNRIWHYHFGTGLVPTPNDFGFMGGSPSHPELLDWLASELIDSHWSLKHIHRLIVTSATYRQASRHRERPASIDAENRLLWRKDPMRLEAEALRDSILSVAGQLNPQYGGAPYRDFTTRTNNTQFYTITDIDHADVYRRTVYRTWIRSGRNPLLDAFDCPDPSTTAPRRAVTTTPIQSLALMNNSFVLRMADRFAQRVTKDVGSQPGNQVERVFLLAYGRKPKQPEHDRIVAFLDQHGLAALCRVIFNSNEFIYVD